MTSQTKHYIEVSDITALHFECRECRTVLVLPLTKDLGNSILQCPVCRKGWARLENSSLEWVVREFVQKCEKLANELPHFGFNLSLELSSDPASRAPDA
jgi:hypothetical protein